MSLNEFLKEDEFTHDREVMLMHRLVFDCRLAFAKRNSRLQVLTGEVDHSGFDIVFDDGDRWKRFQVKSVYGTTSSWEIHKRILRPTTDVADYFGYECSVEGIGICGGVILQELNLDTSGELTVKYRYTDLDILRAFNLGIIKRRHAGSNKAVSSLFHSLQLGYGNISVPKGAFLEAKGPEELMALAGFNTCDCGPWIAWVRGISVRHGGFVRQKTITLPADEAATIELIRKEIFKLTHEAI
jgi:hypothetical protein